MKKLRERQKASTREEILVAAFDLLTSVGYEDTTMQDIADHAGVSKITVFRYFKSKIGVLSAIIRKDGEELFAAGWEIVKNPPPSPVDGITQLLLNDLSILEKPSKKIRSKKFSWPGILTGIEEIDETVKWGDEEILKQLNKMLGHYEKQGLLAAKCDVDSLATILFYITNQYFISFVQTHDVDEVPVHEEFVKLITTTFKNWLAD